MRKAALLTLGLIAAPVAASADMRCEIPKSCKEVVTASFSGGGGKDWVNYVQIFCKNDDGTVATYIDNIVSAAGLIGLNRLTVPGKITYDRSDRTAMKCK